MNEKNYTNIQDPSDEWYDQKVQQAHALLEWQWLNLHYKTVISTVLFACFLEVFLGYMITSTELLKTEIPIYILKYIVVPAALNFALIGIASAVMKSAKLSQISKIYAISLIYVLICAILYTVHSIFILLIIIFVAPILITLYYTNFKLTITTTLFSLFALTTSELFIVWDAYKNSYVFGSYRVVSFLIAFFIIIAVLFIDVIFMTYEKRKNSAWVEIQKERFRLEQQLLFDPLTGIYNRSALHIELKKSDIHNKDGQIILAVADIDRFKDINDKWGHHFGDQCIAAFAGILKEFGEEGIPIRFGGDEFCLLFSKISIAQARLVCETIKKKLINLSFEETPDFAMTVSFGLAESRMDDDEISLFMRADQALYRAKALRNSIYVYEDIVIAN